jgi:hypothetical protein
LNTTGRLQREQRFRSLDRRAMLPEQTLEGREVNLIQAAKFTRANAAVVEALAKHRNKGRQKITIEHVHVYEGGHPKLP